MTMPDQIQITHRPRTMTTPNIRTALKRLVELDKRIEDVIPGIEIDNWTDAMDAARAALTPDDMPQPGDVAELVGWLNQVAQYLVDNGVTGAPHVRGAAILLERQEADLATLNDDDWAKAMTNLVDQIGGDGPSLWEWGASIPTPKKVVEYLREHIDYLEYLGRVQGALTALKVDPVAESERPWKREGWCNEKGDFWAEGINTEGIAEWKQANRNCLGSWMVRCLPHNAIPIHPHS